MNDWAPLVLKAVVPFAAAGLAALLTPAFLPTRSLRRELAVDAGMLEKVPDGPVRAELSASVEGRAVKLLAWTRYRSLTRSELFTFVLSGLLAAVAFWEVADDLFGGEGSELSSGLAFTVTLAAGAMWLLATWSWHSRSIDRLHYLQDRGATEAIADARRGLKVGVYPLLSVLALMLVVQCGAIAGFVLARWDLPLLAVALASVWAVVTVVPFLNTAMDTEDAVTA
ncbi:hypothetical protein [Nocardioides sp. SR21]|uniref:hypothetical protein n=1 Tax=Nocardioides sp. SR21 TaxID=2919501 RepID=UPI001FA998B6|nr:hypothetical protein [Nocardioides sp. SR21]